MIKEEVLKILAVLETAYPNFYKNCTSAEVDQIVTLYQLMFKDCNYRLVSMAITELINTFKYPPTVADIKEKMYELTTHDTEQSATELWDKLLKAIRNGYYGAEEEFKKLPDEVKEFLKSPIHLRELSETDSSTIHTVVKGQFLKQIEIIKKRRKADSMMHPDTKMAINNGTIAGLLNNESQ